MRFVMFCSQNSSPKFLFYNNYQLMGVSGSPDEEIFLLKHPPASLAPAITGRGGAGVAGMKCEAQLTGNNPHSACDVRIHKNRWEGIKIEQLWGCLL